MAHGCLRADRVWHCPPTPAPQQGHHRTTSDQGRCNQPDRPAPSWTLTFPELTPVNNSPRFPTPRFPWVSVNFSPPINLAPLPPLNFPLNFPPPLPPFHLPPPLPLLHLPPPLPLLYLPPPLPLFHLPPPSRLTLPSPRLLPPPPPACSPDCSPCAPVFGSSLLNGTEEAVGSFLGSSLLDETEEAVDSSMGASFSGSQSWESSPLLDDRGRVRGVRIRRVAGCRRTGIRRRRRFSPSSLSGPPACTPAPALWARGACSICHRKLRVNSNLEGEICERCLSGLLPFNYFTNDRQFREAVKGFFEDKRHLGNASQLIFNPLCDELKDTLVDLNQTIGSCSYYDEEQFTKMNQEFMKTSSYTRKHSRV